MLVEKKLSQQACHVNRTLKQTSTAWMTDFVTLFVIFLNISLNFFTELDDSMRDLSFTGCAELSYRFQTFTITFLTVHVCYTFGRCVLCTSVCLSVKQTLPGWIPPLGQYQ